LAVRLTFPPAQNVVGPLGVIDTTGNGLTVTPWLVLALQLFPSVTVTVYVPLVLAVIVRVVAPPVHKYVAPAGLAVRFTLPPAQNVVGPLGVIDTTGNGLTVTPWLVLALQLFTSVTVTVYVPLVLAVIVRVVAPPVHKYVAPAGLAVRFTLPPAQNVVGPLGVMSPPATD